MIRGATRESRQIFGTPTTLGEFRHILQAIYEELTVYQALAANCWFLVSLLQQILEDEAAGSFVEGQLKWGKTAQRIRSRVKRRLRQLYHIPEPPSVSYRVYTLFGCEDVLTSRDRR